MEKISKTLTNNYVLDCEDIHILECGAYDGLETKNLRDKYTCWYLEPDKDLFNKLNLDTDNCLNLALSDKDGEAEFKVANVSGNSSIEHNPKHLEDIKIVETVKVNTISYKTLLDKLQIEKINILILDVEGHEETILNNIFSSLERNSWPDVLCVECGYDWRSRQKIILNAGYSQDFYSYNNCFFSNGKFKLNKESVRKTNSNNQNFIFQSKLIYENDC
jgi:FkbM family methyltransferase